MTTKEYRVTFSIEMIKFCTVLAGAASGLLFLSGSYSLSVYEKSPLYLAYMMVGIIGAKYYIKLYLCRDNRKLSDVYWSSDIWKICTVLTILLMAAIKASWKV